MKKHFSIIFVVILLAITTGSCKKDVRGCTNPNATNFNPSATVDDGSCIVIPFQGPKNPSFETSGYDSYYDWNSSSYVYVNVGAYWHTPILTNGIYSRLTGTSFLPSQGSTYISLSNFSNNGASSANEPQVYFYQDSVDLSHSTTLTFDYTLSCGSPYLGYVQPGSYPPDNTTVTAQILFTSNGTVTLWQQTINGTSTWGAGHWNTTTLPANPIQTLTQTINLPALPSSGRLIFQIVAAASDTNHGPPTGIFGVDNIRVSQ